MNILRRSTLAPGSLIVTGILAVLVSASSPAIAAQTTQAGAAGAPRAGGPAVQDCGTGPVLVRPGNMILTCADDGELATGLHWSSWTAAQATATGSVTWRACSSLCADSMHWDHASADVTLSDPVREPGQGALFTRLTLHVTGPTPRGFMRNLTFNEAPAPPSPSPSPSSREARPAPAPAVPRGGLGYAQIEGYWVLAGGPTNEAGSYTDAQIAAAITGAESSFLPGIIQPGVDYCGAGSDRAGWGLWQITCGNSVPQYGSNFQVLDPWNNAEAAVSKCKQDIVVFHNCFAPWSTYTSGAYVRFLQHTSPDINLTDPGEYVQVNGTPPGTPSSPRPDPGSTYGPPMPSPSVPGRLMASAVDTGVNSAKTTVSLFSLATNGDVWQTYLTAGGKWQHFNLTGNSDAPHAKQVGAAVVDTGVNNPSNPTLSVFSVATNGDVWQTYLTAGGKWQHFNLTGNSDAPPAQQVGAAVVDTGVNNPSNPTLSVFSLATNGDVWQTYLTAGGKWQHFNLTGNSDAPHAKQVGAAVVDTGVNNPSNPTLSVFSLATNGDVWQTYLTAGGKWQHFNLTGNSDAPHAKQVGAAVVDTGVNNPSNPTLSVFSLATNGDVWQTYLTAGGKWQHFNLTGNSDAPPAQQVGAAVVDTGVNNPSNPTLSVFSLATNGDVWQTYLTAGGKWQHFNLTGNSDAPHAKQVGAAVVDTGVNNPSNPTLSVFSLATNGDVWQTYLTAGGKWQHFNLTGNSDAPPAQQVGAAVVDTGVNNPSNPTLSVFSLATNGDVWQTYLTAGGKWQHFNLTGNSDAPHAKQVGAAVVDTGVNNPSNPTLSVFSVATNGDVWQTYLTAGQTTPKWQHFNMTGTGAAPVAQQVGAAVVDTGAENTTQPTLTIFDASTIGQVVQTYLTGGQTTPKWQHYDMTAAGKAPTVP